VTSFALRALFVTAGAAAVGMIGAPLALADEQVTTLGGTADLVSGSSVQQWTVSNLQPSADQIPYTPAGSLWEATATNQAVQGGNIPFIPGFDARSQGESYPVLWNVATPQGVNPRGLEPGQSATGKLYFDVTGPAPTGVAFSDGDNDLAVWTAPPPVVESASSGGEVSAAAPAPHGAPAAGIGQGTAAGSQGTPTATVPTVGSQGTPAAAGTPATAAAVPATPAPAAGSEGTPAAAGTPATAAAVPATPAPAAGSQGTSVGTPAAAPTTTVVPQASSGTPGT
jgi:hypothetical protein